MKYIDKEEKEIVESYNRGEWKSVKEEESKFLKHI